MNFTSFILFYFCRLLLCNKIHHHTWGFGPERSPRGEKMVDSLSLHSSSA